MACLEHHHLATGLAIGENKLMDNAFQESPSPSQCRRSAVAPAPEQLSLLKAGFFASIYIYVYTCQDGGSVDFIKLLFALSPLAQPFNRVRSNPDHFFVILSQHELSEKA